MDCYTEPDFRKAALLTIDMQRDFVLPGAAGAVPGTFPVAGVIARLLSVCRAVHLPVIHVVRLYREDGSNADNCRRSLVASGKPLVRPGTPGAALTEQLLPEAASVPGEAALLRGEMPLIAADEWMMYKPRWGAFYQTPLEDFLRARGVNTLIFTGCNFPNCPRTSLYEASERDFRVIMVNDAVSGLYEQGVKELTAIGTALMSAADLERQLRQISPEA